MRWSLRFISPPARNVSLRGGSGWLRPHGRLGGMTLADIRSLHNRICELKAAYPAPLKTSGVRLEQSLFRYRMTVARLRRSRVVRARSLACLARLSRARARHHDLVARN